MAKIDLFLLKSRNNDQFARCIRGCNRSDKDFNDTVTKWRTCQHLFVKVRDFEHIGAFHSSDCETIPERYECVKCGLTNRLMDSEWHLGAEFLDGLNRKKVSDETSEWRQQQPKISSENLLGDDVVDTCHPAVLFDIAVELCLAQGIGTKKDVFEIMKELCGMENATERLKISTAVQASSLIERYKEKHGLYTD